MKQLLVLGGGLAGLRVAIGASSKLSTYTVTLVDRRECHELPFAPFQALAISKELRAIPSPALHVSYSVLAERHGFTYIRGVVREVSTQEQYVQLADRRMSYDGLVLSMGSFSCAPSQFALPIDTYAQAVRVRAALEFALYNQRQVTASRILRIAIIGGGVSGISWAANLIPLVNSLADTYNIPRTKLELACFEQESRLLPGYTYTIGREVEQCLSSQGIKVICHTRVSKVGQSFIETEDGTRYATDVVLWTGSWQAQTITAKQSVLPLGARKQILVNNKFQVRDFSNIFCIGDQASPPFPHRRGMVRETLAEAEYVADILPRLMQNQHIRPFTQRLHTELVPFGIRTGLSVTHARAHIGLSPFMRLLYDQRSYRNRLG